MIEHDFDTQADHVDFSTARSIAELADVVSMSPRRPSGAVTWEEAAAAVEAGRRGEGLPVERHAFLWGIAAARNRTSDPQLNAAVLRIEQTEAEHGRA